MKERYFLAAVLVLGVSGAGLAADYRPRPVPAKAQEGRRVPTLEDFDIDKVVEAVVKAMADAARNYYLPDKPGSAGAVARYARDARTLAFRDSTYKRELAQVSADLARAAVDAASPETAMLPGRPLELKPAKPDYEEGVSSITVTEGEIMTVYTNTMPCINAAGTTLNRAVREQYIEDAGENAAAKDAYGSQVAAIMSGNRLFNHALSEVCAKLVGLAKMEAGGKKRDNRR